MTDYISREAVLALAKDICVPTKWDTEYHHRSIDPLDVKELPAADVRPVVRGKWIPVTERLPDDRHDVLVYAGVLFPYITVGYYDGLWKFSFDDEEIAGSVDYWMPLPRPPKEET